MRRIIRTPRRLLSVLAALGLMTGLLALIPLVASNATGGPGTAFPMPAGSQAYFTGAQINGEAANSLSWGYQLGADSPVIVDNNGGGYTQVDTPDFRVVPAANTSIRVFLTDNTCELQTDSPATYYSDLTPYDHVAITGTTVYHMEFLDAGGDCLDQNANRYDGPGIYNFKVDLSFDGLPLSVTKVADTSSVEPNGNVNYTITVTNPNVTGASIDTITDDLPAGFTMVPGTTSGVVSSDPAVSDQHLTWDTTETIVPGNSTVELTFQAQAGPDTGDFYNNAGATSPDLAVTPSGDTALVTVIPPSCPSGVSPPGLPTDVVAYPGDGSAGLSWTAPGDTGGAPIDSYTVNTYDLSGGGEAPIHNASAPQSVQVAGTNAQVDGLFNGDTYVFTVQATNCAGTGGESANSNEVIPAPGSSAVVIGPGTLSQSTSLSGSNVPTPGDNTIGVQLFPPGTTGVGTLEEFPEPPPPVSPIHAASLSGFCGTPGACIGNILEAKLHNGTLGARFYRIKLLLDKTLVTGLGKNVQSWYDGNLADDDAVGGDPTPPSILPFCGVGFPGYACVRNIQRFGDHDLRIVVKTQDIDPRLSTSR